jgi:hypothetical protein
MAGLRHDISNNIHFIEKDQYLCYPVGHNIVLYNIEDKSQKYLPGIEGSEAITAMCVHKEKKLLAVAERTERTPIISVWQIDPEK